MELDKKYPYYFNTKINARRKDYIDVKVRNIKSLRDKRGKLHSLPERTECDSLSTKKYFKK